MAEASILRISILTAQIHGMFPRIAPTEGKIPFLGIRIQTVNGRSPQIRNPSREGDSGRPRREICPQKGIHRRKGTCRKCRMGLREARSHLRSNPEERVDLLAAERVLAAVPAAWGAMM